MRDPLLTYVFDKTAGTIQFTTAETFRQERLAGVWNATRGAKLYDPHTTGYGGTFVGDTITLDVDTSAMNDADVLLIFYEDYSFKEVRDILFNTLGFATNIDSKLAPLGPSASIGAMPVVVATDQTVPVSMSAVPTGAATAARQDVGNTSLSTIAGKDFATSAKQDTGNTAIVTVNTSIGTTNTQIGALTETAPATDTASSGLNGRLQRIAQRITSLIGLFPTSIGPKAKSGALAVTTATDDPLLALIGEVQASPTSNTVLDRLKALLTGTSLAASSAIIGNVRIDQTTPGTTNGVVVNDAPTLTKGTQGTKGFAVQNLHDSGRTSIVLYATGAAVGSASTETAITLTKSSGTAATTSADSFVVTSGKTFRIQGVKFKTRANNSATTHTTLVRLRLNTAGAVGTTSTPVLFSGRCISGAVSQDTDVFEMLFPEGYEIVGDGTLQIGVTVNSNYATNAPTIDVAIWGYEY